MGCTFRLNPIGETASRFRAIFRVVLSATHPIRKPRPSFWPKTGPHFPELPRCTNLPRGVPNCRQKRNVPICHFPTTTTQQVEKRSAKTRLLVGDVLKRPVKQERPNDYHGNAAGRGRTAKTPLSEQGDVKRKGADLLVAPLKLNVRLPLRGVCSVNWLRGS